MILNMSKVGDLDVECRWAREAGTNCGVIGHIPCPNVKETMERKIGIYKDALRRSGNPVSSIEWVKKKIWKRGVRGYTTQVTGLLKLEFIMEMPKEVFLGRVRYEVQDYVTETIQCWNCQKLGHISKNCKSQPVCVFCGTKGHRKGDNRCGNKRVCCANCKESHPSSYRGCIAFLREKEAHRIRAKEKTPLHNARRLASAKEFPHLNRPRGEQQGPTNNNPVTEPGDPRGSRDPRGPRDSRGPRDTPRDYAGAVSTSNLAQASNTPTQSAETQPTRVNTEESNAQEQETATQVPIAQEAAAQIGSQACHKCTCNGEDRNLERKLNNILKKTITKLLVGITQVLHYFGIWAVTTPQ